MAETTESGAGDGSAERVDLRKPGGSTAGDAPKRPEGPPKTIADLVRTAATALGISLVAVAVGLLALDGPGPLFLALGGLGLILAFVWGARAAVMAAEVLDGLRERSEAPGS